MGTFKQLLLIDPVDVVQNEENPRIHFPEISMEALADSIDEEGVLVPITVYPAPDTDPPKYILIDGERRWRCARELGLPEVPANVLDQPDEVETLLTMFHIHMVREPWDDMPTAWALGKVMERTGIEDTDELHRKTGLSKTKINQFKHALTLPPEYQALIDGGEVPLNFFTELKKHLLGPLKRRRPAIYEEYGEDRIVAAFVQKRLRGVNTDTVELRKLSPIISVAYEEAGGAEAESDLDNVVRELIEDENTSVTEAYENSVEMVVEAGKFARQCEQLIQRYDRLTRKVESDSDYQLIREALKELADRIVERLA